MVERILDWRPRHDERSRAYGIAEVVGAPEIRPRRWNPGVVLDQGREGACVGFAWTAELLSSPRPLKTDELTGNRYALGVYKDAQKIDYWPGENYEGTSVLAGAQVMQKRGHMNEYRWCFNMNDVRNAILAEGPVVIGIWWTYDMYETRPSGLVKVGGQKVGGHALTLTGYHPGMRIRGEDWHKRYEVYRWKNSWGREYGNKGEGLILAEDLARLLADDGEACVPMNRQRVVLQ